MKKTFFIICSLILGTCIFAQSNRKLIAGVFDFTNTATETWANYETNYISVDPMNEEYEFECFFIRKIITGPIRYDFTCKISKADDDFNVEIEKMTSFNCDKNAQIKPNNKIYNILPITIKEYEKQIKSEISTRMTSWTDEEYSEKFANAVTSPKILTCLSKKSALILKKFIKDNEVIGKPLNYWLIASSVDEAPETPENYTYYVSGYELEKATGDPRAYSVVYSNIYVYTNNDKVLNLKTRAVEANVYASNGSRTPFTDLYLKAKNNNTLYEGKGIIQDIIRDDVYGTIAIKIYE